MNTGDFFKNLVSEKSITWCNGKMSEENTPNKSPSVKLIPNQDYFKIDLRAMFIPDQRKWLTKYHAVVYSFISVPHPTGNIHEFNVITTPSKLQEMDKSNLSRVVMVNIPLLGNVPYTGVNVNMQVGLYSVVSSKITKPIIDLFSEMSKMAGVSFVANALPYVKLLDRGISIISNTESENELEVGFVDTVSDLSTGYYVFTRAPKSRVTLSELMISQEDCSLMFKNGKVFDEFPYIIIEISALKNRNDWFQIPDIKSTYNIFLDKIKTRNKQTTYAALLNLESALKFSGDLLKKDADKIYKKIKKETDEFLTIHRGTTIKIFPEAANLKVF